MKTYFGGIFSIILCIIILGVGIGVFATYEDFSHQLKLMNIDTTKIESQESIARYDLARLLNSVECKDCTIPNQSMINKYTQNFWTTFTTIPDKYFGDINFGGAIYQNIPYYYCVAYVGDNNYMNGYPLTSPICEGKFCGTNMTTIAEFIQVIINIITKYIYKDLRLNRKEVNTRINNLKKDSYEAKNFSNEDKKIIEQKAKKCETNCTLEKPEEVKLYLKYCMFNISKCNMQEIGKIKQGYWPIAELNLLYKQNIINIDQNQWRNTAKNIDGKLILETLFKLNQKINCTFNNDYDCDGISNTKDNCPNTYNPKQKDTDTDNIGDVCDDDIDNDTIKNPIGIVDDEGKIDISKRTKNTDNCIFINNTHQQDNNKNNIGDACENTNEQIGLYINIKEIKGDNAPLTVTFEAISTGSIQEIERDFGDGSQGKGSPITHIFSIPKLYHIQALAKGIINNATAQITINVGGTNKNNAGLYIKTNSAGGKSPMEINFSSLSTQNIDQIDWIFPKENSSSRKNTTQTIKKSFKTSGEHPILIKGYQNNTLVAISYGTIGINEGIGAILKSNTIAPEINQPVLFDTQTYNIQQKDIASVIRDFGDGNVIKNTALTTQHTYTKKGKKVVIQNITFTNTKKLTNFLTININDKRELSSYAMIMTPSKLFAEKGEKISFTTNIIGNILKIPLIQIRNFGDDTIQKITDFNKLINTLDHSYQKTNIIEPQSTLYIDQCTYLKNQATISINTTDNCLMTKIQGTLTSTYKCDQDKDEIPDICDTDIDGDGIPNLLGLINKDNKDCSRKTNGKNTNINNEILKKHYQGICSLDNAPFTPNQDQLDLNQDGIGDNQTGIIVNLPTINNDTDGDGIIDNEDLCPTIQETWNSIQDNDGCPEIGQDMNCNQYGIDPLIHITNDSFIVKPIDITTPILLTGCGNTIIEPGENCNNCPQDVGTCTSFCGDGIIAPGENCINCPADSNICGTCGNNKKDPNENCKTCPQDYGNCTSTINCGNGIIDQGETCNNCPQDVRLCIDLPDAGICNQCPCPYSDFSSDLTTNDQVRAILRDYKKTIQYKISTPWIINF